MDATYEELSRRIIARSAAISNYNDRNIRSECQDTLTLISGPPGSGKSTLASNVVQLLNNSHYLSNEVEYDNSIDNNMVYDITKHPIFVELFDKIPNFDFDPTSNTHAGLEDAEYPILPLKTVAKDTKENIDVFSLIENDNISFVPIRKWVSSDRSSMILSRRSISNRIRISLLSHSERKISTKASTKSSSIVIPMDGFHYPRSLFIPESPLSSEILKRRGCPASFDSFMIVKLIEILKFITVNKMGNSGARDNWPFLEISVPGFNHIDKDPTPDSIFIRTDIHKNLIMEGLYLSTTLIQPWCQISEIIRKIPRGASQNICESWFVKATNDNDEYDDEIQIYMKRVGKRHLEAGLVNNLNEGYLKFSNNDLLNCEFIMNDFRSRNNKAIDLIILSVQQ